MTRVTTTVEVDIHDFDEEEILSAAASLRSKKGFGDRMAEDVSDCAAAIAAGRTDEALERLAGLFDDRPLRDAVDIGRRRR